MANVNFEIDARDLQRKLARLSGELDSAMTGAVDAVVQRVINQARTTDLFRDRTGALRASIRAGQTTGKFSTGTLRAAITAGGGTVNYALFVHDGTRPHPIEPRTARALRIPTGAGFIFRRKVQHPGTRPRPFMTRAVEAVTPEIPRIVEAFTTAAIRQAGLA